VNSLGHDEGLTSRLEVADDARVVEPTIQQEKLGVDACGDNPAAEFADDVTHGRATADGEDGERESESIANDEGGGVAVEVCGAVLGLRSEDLGAVEEGFAVVGDECGVDGNDPLSSPEASRHRSLEQESESSVECIAINELLSKSSHDDVSIDSIAESNTGIGDGGDAGGGVGEDGNDDIESAGANGRPDPEERGEKLTGQVLDFVGTEDMLHSTHG